MGENQELATYKNLLQRGERCNVVTLYGMLGASERSPDVRTRAQGVCWPSKIVLAWNKTTISQPGAKKPLLVGLFW